ncbi:MAG: prolipoprotein diacylglyceryl transferase [Clostridia bacterium]|nr:prolipoprotein diacylglyceryl transferase [Clostridia bacterium]
MFSVLTAYGWSVVGAVVMAVLLLAAAMKRSGVRAWPVFAALCVLLGAAGARGYYILTQNVLCGYPMFGVVSFYPYEHAMCGAVLGVCLALLLGAKVTRQKAAAVLDAAVPAGLVMIALARAAEAFSDFGWGKVVENPAMQRFPLSVMDMYDQWHWAVFMLESVFALLALVYVMRVRCAREGERFSLALLWWAIPQIFCESFRVETLRWGFVRVQQAQCAVFVLALLLYWGRACGMSRQAMARRLAAFALSVGVVVFVEFGLDKINAIPNAALYALMAADLLALGVMVQKIVPSGNRA